MLAFGSIWILFIKIDIILAEIQSNLSLYKVFYNLIKNLKSHHKLTEINYKKLTILSGFIQGVILEAGIPITLITASTFIISIAISSQKTIWILQSIYLLPGLLISGVTLALWMCILFIVFSYYKLRFDQINHRISKLFNQKSNVINMKREKLLIYLIKKHNFISIEMNEINLMIRRSAAVMFIILSISKSLHFIYY